MNTTRPRLSIFWIGLAAAGLTACGGSAMKGPSSASGPYSPGDESPAAEEADYEPGYAAGGAPSPSQPSAAPAPPSAGESYKSPAPASRERADAARPYRSGEAMEPRPVQPTIRPGLGTEWGETRYSRVTSSPFIRADRSSPFATAKLFYNDRQGIQDMLQTWGGSPHYTTRFAVHGGHLDVALRDGSGSFLSGLDAGGRNYVTGNAGSRYTIVIDNRSPGRIEAIVSVDGLDVIDGQSASFSKRGYLLEPHGHLEIEGFRRSEQEVASFRFGSVRGSYASRKHGSARNVGVIGFAFFHERGDAPGAWSRPRRWDEANLRHSADPFPNRYATPPN